MFMAGFVTLIDSLYKGGWKGKNPSLFRKKVLASLLSKIEFKREIFSSCFLLVRIKDEAM